MRRSCYQPLLRPTHSYPLLGTGVHGLREYLRAGIDGIQAMRLHPQSFPGAQRTPSTQGTLVSWISGGTQVLGTIPKTQGTWATMGHPGQGTQGLLGTLDTQDAPGIRGALKSKPNCEL